MPEAGGRQAQGAGDWRGLWTEGAMGATSAHRGQRGTPKLTWDPGIDYPSHKFGFCLLIAGWFMSTQILICVAIHIDDDDDTQRERKT